MIERKVAITTWKIEDRDKWMICTEEELDDELGEMLDEYISNKRYLRFNLNLIMLTQLKNCSMFLDTSTGNYVGIGCWWFDSLVQSVD